MTLGMVDMVTAEGSTPNRAITSPRREKRLVQSEKGVGRVFRRSKISAVRTIVTIVGSSQPSSFTGKALAVVNDELSRLGFDVSTFDGGILRLDFPGRPASEDGVRLRAAVRDAAGVVLSTPEYHGSMSAMIKLAIENMGFPSALQGKPVALLGVAAGRIGAVKSVEQLRGVCGHVGALVVPNAISIANVQQAFDANGRVTESGHRRGAPRARVVARVLHARLRVSEVRDGSRGSRRRDCPAVDGDGLTRPRL